MSKFISYKLYLTVLFTMSIACLVSCAAPGYRAQNKIFGDGYRDFKMGENTYKIIYDCFRGVSRETCEAYLFRRCAEITRNHGFHYFVIDDIGNNIIRKDYINSDEATTTELVSGKCKNSTYAYVTGSEYTMIEPHYFATITLYKGERPADLPNSFTPDQIISNMK